METVSASFVDWGVAERSLSGEVESGDRCLVKPFPGGVLVAAVDGLGHGPEAAAAAARAIGTLERHAQDSVVSLVRRCHESLQGTRGAVMSLASLSAAEGTMTWLGVGNVEGVLIRSDARMLPPRESLLLRGGIVGGRVPLSYASIIGLCRGDTVIFATDGIKGGFATARGLDEPPDRVAGRILREYGMDTDDALVLVVRYLGRDP